MPRRPLFAWILAVALLFGQAAAFAHALSHLDKHDGGARDPVCEVCVAQADLGGTPPPSGFSPPAEPPRQAPLPTAAQHGAGICPLLARARAPPTSV